MEKLIVTANVHEVFLVKSHLQIAFENLKSLCHLAIKGVELESLPKGIGQLKLLKYLSLSRSRHQTSLPESLWELESLVELNLSGTGLKGFSGRIGSMIELKVLILSKTNIRTLPEGIRGLVKLELLNLSSCLDLQQIPSEIGDLFSLKVLNFSDTRLQHLYLNNCLKLRNVEQPLTSFSLQVVPDLSNLVNIVELELLFSKASYSYHCPSLTNEEEDRWTRFRSLDFAWIERFPKLKSLVIVDIVLMINHTE